MRIKTTMRFHHTPTGMVTINNTYLSSSSSGEGAELLELSYISLFHHARWSVSSVQLLNHVLTLGNAMDCSMLGFPVHHQLPELAQTHVH